MGKPHCQNGRGKYSALETDTRGVPCLSKMKNEVTDKNS